MHPKSTCVKSFVSYVCIEVDHVIWLSYNNGKEIIYYCNYPLVNAF
jgi:hypothetical protein